MPVRRRTFVLLLSAWLVAGCSAEPVSIATSLPSTPSPASPTSGTVDTSPEPSASLQLASPSSSAPAVIASEPPPKPGDPTFEQIKSTPNATGGFTEEYKITWTSPEGVATSFLVYGVTECLRYARKYDGKPCVVRGMKIPTQDLVLLGEVPGDARSMTISWDVGEIDVPPYSAILIRATNAAGNSIFTIVHSENVCWGCTY